MIRYCLTLDLKNDEALIAEYEKWHRQVWPEVTQSIISAGIKSMEIYRVSTRLFMIMEVGQSFNFENKAKADADNVKVQEWEELMLNFQQPLTFAEPGVKWVLMNKIFDLKD